MRIHELLEVDSCHTYMTREGGDYSGVSRTFARASVRATQGGSDLAPLSSFVSLFQEFGEPQFNRVAGRTFAVRRDPFRMLHAQVAVNLLL